MTEKISLYAANQLAEDVSPPIPGNTHLPQYLRAIASPTRSQPTFHNNQFQSNVRACVPFFDAVTAGWIQHSWCDIHISNIEGTIHYHFSDGQVPIMSHREMRAEMAQAWRGYSPIEFMWISQWQPKTPPGYSLLITHPLNRLDLPFTTSSGIIDSDVFTVEGNGQVPFYLHDGFTGLIRSGTPLYQLIPIKRSSWERNLLSHDDKSRPETMRRIRRYFTGGYRKEFWIKKAYT